MASPEVFVGAIGSIVTGAAAFLGAGAKFITEVKGIKEQVAKDVLEILKRDHLVPQAARMEALEKRHDANVTGWGLELQTLKNDLDEMALNRGHGHQSVVDYHTSEELVQRLEVLERTLENVRRAGMTRKQFEAFVADQNEKALDVARLLGQIEGELKARFTSHTGIK